MMFFNTLVFDYCNSDADLVLPEPKNVKTFIRKDYCYDCKNDGEWVMMALRCTDCKKILIGGD